MSGLAKPDSVPGLPGLPHAVLIVVPAKQRLYTQRLCKGQRAEKEQGNGVKEKGPTRKGQKAPLVSPSSGVRHILAVPA